MTGKAEFCLVSLDVTLLWRGGAVAAGVVLLLAVAASGQVAIIRVVHIWRAGGVLLSVLRHVLGHASP